MNATRGVFGMTIPTYNADQIVGQVINQAKEMGMVKAGQKIAIVHGMNEEQPDESNVMKILDA